MSRKFKTSHRAPAPPRADRFIQAAACWYTARQWEKIKATAADPEIWLDTYEEWVEAAEKAVRDARSAGLVLEKVHIDADRFFAWLELNGRVNDATTRAEYVTLLTLALSEGTEPPPPHVH
jgi:hypothetical protein